MNALADQKLRFEMFYVLYKEFLQYEKITKQKELWDEQKRIYESILNAPEPMKALDQFLSLGMTTMQLAQQRMLPKNKWFDYPDRDWGRRPD